MSWDVSVSNGRGYLRHTNREIFAKNVDESRTKDNVVVKQETLEQAYEEAFGEAIEEYNKGQKRADRRLTPQKYLEKIRKGADKKNTPKPFYETVVQVGNKDNVGILEHPENAEKAKEILLQYAREFEKNNPHLKVFNVVLHMDEASPHLHIDWIPVAEFKKGLGMRNSLEKSMKQAGYTFEQPSGKRNNGRAAWQNAQRDRLVEICRSRGIEAKWTRHGPEEQQGHLSNDDMRVLGKIADTKATVALDEAKEAAQELGTGVKGMLNRARHPEIVQKAVEKVSAAAALQKSAEEQHKATQAQERAKLDALRVNLQAQARTQAARSQAQDKREEDLDAREYEIQRVEGDQAATNVLQQQKAAALDDQERDLAEQRRQLDISRRAWEKEEQDRKKALADQEKKSQADREQAQKDLDSKRAAFEADKKEYAARAPGFDVYREYKKVVGYNKDWQAANEALKADFQKQITKLNTEWKAVYDGLKADFDEQAKFIKDQDKKLGAKDRRIAELTNEKIDKESRAAAYEEWFREERARNDRLQGAADEAKKATARAEKAEKSVKSLTVARDQEKRRADAAEKQLRDQSDYDDLKSDNAALSAENEVLREYISILRGRANALQSLYRAPSDREGWTDTQIMADMMKGLDKKAQAAFKARGVDLPPVLQPSSAKIENRREEIKEEEWHKTIAASKRRGRGGMSM